MKTAQTKTQCIPDNLWETLTDDERQALAKEDGGYVGWVGEGPWKCHYFTTWNSDGKPIATYDKNGSQWTLRTRYE